MRNNYTCLPLTDRHTFTIGAPYNIYQPTMTGQVIVLPLPAVEKPAAVVK
jgi:hypothetical protein